MSEKQISLDGFDFDAFLSSEESTNRNGTDGQSSIFSRDEQPSIFLDDQSSIKSSRQDHVGPRRIGPLRQEQRRKSHNASIYEEHVLPAYHRLNQAAKEAESKRSASTPNHLQLITEQQCCPGTYRAITAQPGAGQRPGTYRAIPARQSGQQARYIGGPQSRPPLRRTQRDIQEDPYNTSSGLSARILEPHQEGYRFEYRRQNFMSEAAAPTPVARSMPLVEQSPMLMESAAQERMQCLPPDQHRERLLQTQAELDPAEMVSACKTWTQTDLVKEENKTSE